MSFRLSTEEYAAVQESWRAAGYRSTSSFARGAMRAFVPPPTGDQFDGETKELRHLVEELVLELKRLSELLGNDQQPVCAACGAPRLSQGEAVPSEDIEVATLGPMKAGGAR